MLCAHFDIIRKSDECAMCAILLFVIGIIYVCIVYSFIEIQINVPWLSNKMREKEKKNQQQQTNMIKILNAISV